MTEPKPWTANHWWGEPWPSADSPADVCADPDLRYPHFPLGENCLLCDEEIVEGDSGITMAAWQAEVGGSVIAFIHKECNLRAMLGNHLHVRGLCSYVGECVQLSKLTYRQEALSVWAWVQEHGTRELPPA